MSDIEALRLCKDRFGCVSTCDFPDLEDPAPARYVSGQLAAKTLGFEYRAVETTILEMAAELLGDP